MGYTLRPLPEWPHKPTSPRRYAQFKHGGRSISWEQTRRELQYEVDQLSDSRYETDIIIGVGLTEYDIRQDGAPRANARPMLHPGVEISFDSRYGRLTYATDVFTTWQDNAPRLRREAAERPGHPRLAHPRGPGMTDDDIVITRQTPRVQSWVSGRHWPSPQRTASGWRCADCGRRLSRYLTWYGARRLRHNPRDRG